MSTINVRKLIDELKALKNNLPHDKALSKELYTAARDLELAVEDSQDTIHRIIYTPLQLSAAKVGGDLKLFEILTKSESPLSTAELSKSTGCDGVLLERILRYLATVGMIAESGESKFSATNITRSLAIPGFMSGVRHSFAVLVPCYQALPAYLADTKYANPSDVFHSPFQIAHKTDKPAFLFAIDRPDLVGDFNLWMEANHSTHKTWLDVFQFDKLCQGSDPETPIFVDVGGGIGHQCAALKAKYPSLKGRVILQDLPMAIEHSLPMEGVEKTGFDFWGEQPIKGARAYYLRNILHDYPDAKCVELLNKTKAALGKDSVILIDDMIIPNTGAHWHAAQQDLSMMASLASMERSEKQWQALLDSAGLKIKESYPYTDETRDSLIVAVPK